MLEHLARRRQAMGADPQVPRCDGCGQPFLLPELSRAVTLKTEIRYPSRDDLGGVQVVTIPRKQFHNLHCYQYWAGQQPWGGTGIEAP